MPRPVCATCQREMQLLRAVVVQFNALSVGGAYQQWHGDLAKCDTCGAEVIVRWAEQPSWQSHQRLTVPLETPDIIIPERPLNDYPRPLGATPEAPTS